jgi:hypothetical protein
MDLLAFAMLVVSMVTLQFGWYVFNKEDYSWKNLLFLTILLMSVVGVAVLGLTVGGWMTGEQLRINPANLRN